MAVTPVQNFFRRYKRPNGTERSRYRGGSAGRSGEVNGNAGTLVGSWESSVSRGRNKGKNSGMKGI